MPVDVLLFALALEVTAGEMPRSRANSPAGRPASPTEARSGDWELLEFLGGWEAGIEPHMIDEPLGATNGREAPPAEERQSP